MDILDSKKFRLIMYFKFFMVIAIWGLVPLLIPVTALPLLGLHIPSQQVVLLRVWGGIVLFDFFVYFYIFKRPHTILSKYLIVFAILDNGGIGLLLLGLLFFFRLPWGIWINIPFQLFFGFWFLRFLQLGSFSKK